MRQWRVCAIVNGVRVMETIKADTMAIDSGLLYFFYYDRMGLRYEPSEWVYVEMLDPQIVYAPRFYNQWHYYDMALKSLEGDLPLPSLRETTCPLKRYLDARQAQSA